jgi:Uma2 family endonuclease
MQINQLVFLTADETWRINLAALRRRLSDDEFYQLCQENEEFLIERSAAGEAIVQPLSDAETSHRNFVLTVEFGQWAEQNGQGIGFASATGFTLPNGAIRSPNLSWIRRERWEALPPKARQKFAHICPDFVVELRSQTDQLKTLQAKMEEYLENGAQLGWLIDPLERKVHLYEPNHPVNILPHPETVSGDPFLPGFTLPMNLIWD